MLQTTPKEEIAQTLSVRGAVWRVRNSEKELPEALPVGVPKTAVQIAHNRGTEDLEAFFYPTLEACLPTPFVLAGMKEAVSMFCDGLRNGKKFAILGDYDVDGATSTSLLLRYIAALNGDAIFHIPQRLTEGYGPNIPAIESLRENGADILIIADSGTTSLAPVARARELGMGVIILDHHEPPESGELPDAILVNPKLPENMCHKLDYLCTAGLAYLFLVGVNAQFMETGFLSEALPTIEKWLGLVALGTVADVVPLVGLNRAYVVNGLAKMGEISGILGLRRAMAKFSGDEGNAGPDYTVYSCGFAYGPSINAAGRISDTMLGTRLLISEDEEEIQRISEMLVALNKERQEMQRMAVDLCIARAEEGVAGVVIYDEEIHPGIVGLCASKLKDYYDVPAVVIGTDGKGSGRSVDGCHIGHIFHRAVEAGLIVKGGGHSAAGGLTIEPDKVEQFTKFFIEEAARAPKPTLWIDVLANIEDLTEEFVSGLRMMAPFGAGNSRPLVLLGSVRITQMKMLKGRHLKARLGNERGAVDIIVFDALNSKLGQALIAHQGDTISIVGDVSVNEFRGKRTVQFQPVDFVVEE